MLSNLRMPTLRNRDIAIIVIVLSLVVGAVWFFYMYSPTQDRITQLELDIDNLDIQIRDGEAAQANLPDLRAERARAELDRIAFLAELPKESEVADLIDQLRLSATNVGVILNSVSQAGTSGETIEDVRPISYSLATLGNYGETMSFLQSLESLRRFTKIQQVGLSTTQDDSSNPDLSANFTFTVYVFTGEDPGAEQ